MCALCEIFGDFGYHPIAAANAVGDDGGVPVHAAANAINDTTDPAIPTNNAQIDGLLYGTKWSGTITYSFPDSGSGPSSDYGVGYGSGEPTNGFSQVTEPEKTVINAAFAQISGFTNASIVFNQQAGVSDKNADIKIARSSEANPTSYAYYPGNYEEGGDVWIGTQYDYSRPTKGDYSYLTHFHELGHAMGLKHSQETGGVANTAVPSGHDALEYTVMSYRSYVGGPTSGGYSNEQFGFPQSYMMNDILALQTLYGANYSLHSSDTVYTFDPTTGEMRINGVGQGRPGGASPSDPSAANRIFLTIWDG